MSKIHGHTSIILKSRHGLVERYESENTFQGSMIAKYLKASEDTPFSSSPFVFQNDAPWKKLVGGLFLFRDEIDEGSQFMPAGNVMVGKASVDLSNSDNPPEMGSYNAVESSGSGSSLTQVYDFATNQANGQIGCVCLTSQEGGIVGYGNASGTQYSSLSSFGRKYVTFNSSSLPLYGQLADDGCRYLFTVDTTNSILTVKKTRTCGVKKGSALAGLSSTTSHDISGFQNIYKNNQWRSFYCGNNIFRFLPLNEYSVLASGTVYYVEYDTATDTLTEKSFVNLHSDRIYTGTSSYYNNTGGFTKDGKIAVATSAYSQAKFLIINLTSGAIEFYDENGSDGDCPSPIHISNGLYLLDANNKAEMVDVVNGTQYPIDTNGVNRFTNAPNGGFQEVIYGNNSRPYIIPNPLYLATINNLQSPVQKDASKTMKVIYRLEEV